MATHPSILAWEMSWTEELGGLQSMGRQSWTGLSDCAHTFTLCGHCLKNFIEIKNSQQSSKIPSSPFYRWGNQGPKRLRLLPMVTQGVNGATGI